MKQFNYGWNNVSTTEKVHRSSSIKDGSGSSKCRMYEMIASAD